MFIVPLSGSVRGIIGEGMPIYKNPFEKGDLYIRIEVDFPENYFAPEAKLKVCINILLYFLTHITACYIWSHIFHHPYSMAHLEMPQILCFVHMFTCLKSSSLGCLMKERMVSMKEKNKGRLIE